MEKNLNNLIRFYYFVKIFRALTRREIKNIQEPS